MYRVVVMVSADHLRRHSLGDTTVVTELGNAALSAAADRSFVALRDPREAAISKFRLSKKVERGTCIPGKLSRGALSRMLYLLGIAYRAWNSNNYDLGGGRPPLANIDEVRVFIEGLCARAPLAMHGEILCFIDGADDGFDVHNIEHWRSVCATDGARQYLKDCLRHQCL